jgi:malic enzyme
MLSLSFCALTTSHTRVSTDESDFHQEDLHQENFHQEDRGHLGQNESVPELTSQGHGQDDDAMRLRALAYHRVDSPGKIKIMPSKPMNTQDDLALAYSPGVAEPCLEIARDPSTAALYTNRQSLVAVISNGTAVLGLGDLGALASKPVMEGKAALFQKFSGLNAVDIEIDETDPVRLIQVIAALAPSFGGINLEDIKAPECFQVEEALEAHLDIPVFHDDQHGTAITVSAAVLNALTLVGKNLQTAKCVVSGAGASALACLTLLVHLGLDKANIFVCDSKGVVHSGRTDLTPHKAAFARDTDLRHLDEAVQGADILIGLSRARAFTPAMIAGMAPRPIVMALANPIPEIYPDEVTRVAVGALVGTGRSDLPNQINNVLCFPYIFRGALDVAASHITLDMKQACVQALAQLAQTGFSDLVGAYQVSQADFGSNYFLPKAFDPRLGVALPVAVARAAMASGVARQSICLHTYKKERIRSAFADMPLLGTLISHVDNALGFVGGSGDLDPLKARQAPSNLPHVYYRVSPQEPGWKAVSDAACALARYGWAVPGFIGDEADLRPILKATSPLLVNSPIVSLGQIKDDAAVVWVQDRGCELDPIAKDQCHPWALYQLDGQAVAFGMNDGPDGWLVELLDEMGWRLSQGQGSSSSAFDPAQHDSKRRYTWNRGPLLPQAIAPYIGPLQNNPHRQHLVWNCSAKLVLEASALVALGQVSRSHTQVSKASLRD